MQDALQLALYLAKKHIHTEQDPFTGEKIYVAKSLNERMMQRALLQHKNPQSRQYILKALKILDREDLKKVLLE